MEEYHSDWQSGKSVTECNKFMLEHTIGCDVTFKIGLSEELFKAHKYVLASRSSVFFAMFYGPFHNDTSCTSIEIPDIDPEIFKNLLNFIYLEEVYIDSENVTQILYAAHKYGISQLSGRCKAFLEQNINAENVSVILENAHVFDEDELYQKCITYIFKNPYECVNSEQFSNLCRTCFEKVMSSDDLHLDEDIILQVVMKWGANECRKQSLQVSDKNCRKVLGDLFYTVRFPLMNLQCYADKVAASCNALNEKEKIDLFFYMAGKQKVFNGANDKFVCRRRKPFTLTCRRLGPVEMVSIDDFRWKIGKGKLDKIDFSVSHNVLIHGIMVYGGRIENSSYKVVSWLRNHSNDEVLGYLNTELQTTVNQKCYQVLYRKPVQVNAHSRYSIHLLMKGPKTYWSESGLSSVECQDVTFTFYDSAGGSNGTSQTRGQIPCILFTRHPANSTDPKSNIM